MPTKKEKVEKEIRAALTGRAVAAVEKVFTAKVNDQKDDKTQPLKKEIGFLVHGPAVLDQKPLGEAQAAVELLEKLAVMAIEMKFNFNLDEIEDSGMFLKLVKSFEAKYSSAKPTAKEESSISDVLCVFRVALQAQSKIEVDASHAAQEGVQTGLQEYIKQEHKKAYTMSWAQQAIAVVEGKIDKSTMLEEQEKLAKALEKEQLAAQAAHETEKAAQAAQMAELQAKLAAANKEIEENKAELEKKLEEEKAKLEKKKTGKLASLSDAVSKAKTFVTENVFSIFQDENAPPAPQNAPPAPAQ